MEYPEIRRPGQDPIQGLWIGPALSAVERLSILSFLANGHDYHLYVYDDVAGVPEGTTLRDAAEILPRSRIFYYSERESVAGFSNFFRYKLLLERGGWWADLDVVCLQPFRFESQYVFSTEVNLDAAVLSAGVIRCPPSSAFAEYAWRVCESKDVALLKWGETGPRLVAEAVAALHLHAYIRSPEVFCPISYMDWESILRHDPVLEFGVNTYAVHLWNEMWRLGGKGKDGPYPESCAFERLKRRWLPEYRTA
jgi:hypothetical protein